MFGEIWELQNIVHNIWAEHEVTQLQGNKTSVQVPNIIFVDPTWHSESHA